MDPRVTRVIEMMDERLDRPVALTEFADAVNLSPSRMARVFKQHTGKPPARYLHDLRLTRARVLLERTYLSVKQVMVCVGLHDPSHFSRDFRRAHGFSPSHLRQRSWAADHVRNARPFEPDIDNTGNTGNTGS